MEADAWGKIAEVTFSFFSFGCFDDYPRDHVLDSAAYLTKFEAGRPLVMEQRDRALALILTLAAAVEAESVAA